VSLICIRQTDLKSLIAYSSVAHISIVIGGIITMSYWGLCGSFTLIIAHGLCSSGLFCLANISYERLGSRRLLISRGLSSLMPRISFWWFILSFYMKLCLKKTAFHIIALRSQQCHSDSFTEY
jgi:NADH-ubiquinone oxidoreductase chain 4